MNNAFHLSNNIHLITGGFGFLGQYITWGLLKQGFTVILIARAKNESEKTQRLQSLQTYNTLVNPLFHVTQEQFKNCHIVSGDMSLPKLGLTGTDYENLVSLNIDTIWNVAACMQYEKENYDISLQTNVYSLQELLCIAKKTRSHINHISTAFIGGKASQGGPVIQEKLYSTDHFFNSYDATKNKAEHVLLQQSDVPVSIFRPSIIIGDSITGMCSSDFGFYEFIKLFNRFKSHNLTLSIYKETLINLIPVDICGTHIINLGLTKTRAHNQIFTIADPDPYTGETICTIIGKCFSMNIDFIPFEKTLPQSMNKKEVLFNKIIRRSKNFPFVLESFSFSTANTEKALGSSAIAGWNKSISFFEFIIKKYIKTELLKPKFTQVAVSTYKTPRRKEYV